MPVDQLVHANYPVEYFSLENVDRIQYPHQSWWASRQRFAAMNPNTSGHRYLATNRGGERTWEYLEIDLGRVRQVNFLTMQVFKVPVNIAIEYDAVSADDGTHAWRGVTPMTEMEYDAKVRYRPDHKNPWEKCNFYFTDTHGQMIHTRYLRLRFLRIDQRFPTRRHAPIRYSVMVKGLRTARLVAGLKDTVGPIFNSGIDEFTAIYGLMPNADPALTVEGASEIIKQNFVVPESARRGAIHSDENDLSVFPAILGAGVLVFNNVDGGEDSEEEQFTPRLVWEIRDVTDPAAEVVLRQGEITDTPVTGRTWVDFYFNETPIEADPSKTYQLRIYSAEMNTVGSLYNRTPNNLPGKEIPGTLNWQSGSASVATTADTTSVVSAGDFIMKPSGEGGVFEVQSVNATTITLTGNFTGITEPVGTGVIVMPIFHYDEAEEDYMPEYTHNLTMRLWGDVADSGRDILGNDYRYATYRDKAENVFDGTRAGWVSAPMPDPNAVESLYFDVRTDTAGVKSLTVIDALRVAPLVPGVTMHVYYCDGWLNSKKPSKIEEWENLIWKPVPFTFNLRSEQQFRLPTQIAASFIKLEFTNLKPRPFRIPRYPELPPVHYKRYPSWVEAQFENAQVRRVVNDWFVRHRTKVMRNVLKRLDDPMARFQYKLREFLASLALGKIGRRERAVKEGLIDLKAGAFIDPVTAGKIYVNTRHLYKGTLKVTLDQDSLLGQMVANIHDPRIVGDPVEGEVNFSDQAVVPIVSSLNDRVTYSYAHLAQTPMWFNRPARHRYRKEVARFNKKAYFAGVAEVAFLRSDFTVARDDEVITETFADEAMVESNTFDLETLGAITSGQTVYVSYEVPNPGFVQDEAVLLSGGDRVKLAEAGAEPAINVRVFEQPNFQGKEYLLGEDFDLSFDTDDAGRTTNYIERNTIFTRTKVRRPAEGYTNIDVGMVVGRASLPIIREYIDQNVVTGTAIVSSAIEYTEAGTATGDGTPITTHESRGWDHAATVAGVAMPSAALIYGRSDAGTVAGIGVVSAVDLANLSDPADLPFLDSIYASDDFNREGGEWDVSSSGFMWMGPEHENSIVDGTRGQLFIEPPLTMHDMAMLQAEMVMNMRVQAEVSWSHDAHFEPHHSNYLVARAMDDDNYYYLAVTHHENNSVMGEIGKVVAGVDTILIDFEIEMARTPGASYYARFEVEEDELRGKAWRKGAVEPSGWGATTTDMDIMEPGMPGVAAAAHHEDMPAIEFYFENFVATTESSVPISVGEPITTHESNTHVDTATVTGTAVPSATIASVQKRSAGSGVSSGATGVVWGTPGNIITSNDARATVTLGPGGTSRSLIASSFGFNVPAGATIVEILVFRERSVQLVTGSGVSFNEQISKLRKAGVSVGSDRLGVWSNSTSDITDVRGGFLPGGDLWGTTWTPAEINNSGFGYELKLIGEGGPGTSQARIDHIIITVEYTL